MNKKDKSSFRDIQEIWDAIDKEYKSFPEKYTKGKRAIEELI